VEKSSSFLSSPEVARALPQIFGANMEHNSTAGTIEIAKLVAKKATLYIKESYYEPERIKNIQKFRDHNLAQLTFGDLGAFEVGFWNHASICLDTTHLTLSKPAPRFVILNTFLCPISLEDGTVTWKCWIIPPNWMPFDDETKHDDDERYNRFDFSRCTFPDFMKGGMAFFHNEMPPGEDYDAEVAFEEIKIVKIPDDDCHWNWKKPSKEAGKAMLGEMLSNANIHIMQKPDEEPLTLKDIFDV
jgi:hypothetical protein